MASSKLVITIDQDWLALVAYRAALEAIAELPSWANGDAVDIALDVLDAFPDSGRHDAE